MEEKCICHRQLLYWDAISCSLETIDINGLGATIYLKKCLQCHSIWLNCFLEYDHLPNSFRWFRGVVTSKQAQNTTTDNVIEQLNQLAWHQYGGAFYDLIGSFRQSTQKINRVNLR